MDDKLHPVVKHLLERRHQTVPVADGRRIALVHFGGVILGIRGAAALTGLLELGLGGAFDDIYATSAGFPNACYFLTDNRAAASIYYTEMCSKEFINLERVWDLVNTDYVLKVLREVKPLDYERVSKSPTRLYARLFNLLENKTEYKLVSGLPPEEIESVMHAAISIPYLDPGHIDINGHPYKDAGWYDERADKLVKDILATEATDILVIYNYEEQYEELKRAGLRDSERVYQITPYAEDRVSRVCTDPAILKATAERYGNMVKSIFGSDEPVNI